jgi:hypothetical protein
MENNNDNDITYEDAMLALIDYIFYKDVAMLDILSAYRQGHPKFWVQAQDDLTSEEGQISRLDVLQVMLDLARYTDKQFSKTCQHMNQTCDRIIRSL